MFLKFENKAIAVIGDIHGTFEVLHTLLKNVENCVVFIAGDCGFGFSDTKVFKIKKMIAKNFDAFLEKRNLHLIFIRGNHDNPEYFLNEDIRKDISNDRFILVPDYTYVEVDTTKILCVGGAVSVDRRFRKLNTDYWYGEEMSNVKHYAEIKNMKIDVLITHAVDRDSIQCNLPPMPDWLKISYDVDKKLALDCDREHKICLELFDYYNPKLWYHGHYHITHRVPIKDSTIIGLNINEIAEIKLNSFYEK